MRVELYGCSWERKYIFSSIQIIIFDLALALCKASSQNIQYRQFAPLKSNLSFVTVRLHQKIAYFIVQEFDNSSGMLASRIEIYIPRTDGIQFTGFI